MRDSIISIKGFDANWQCRGWIKWDGGECPVLKSTLVALKLRIGDVMPSSLGAHYRWSNTGNPSDIVAYKVLTP